MAADRPSSFGNESVQQAEQQVESQMGRYASAARNAPGDTTQNQPHVGKVPGSDLEAADMPSKGGPGSVQQEAAHAQADDQATHKPA